VINEHGSIFPRLESGFDFWQPAKVINNTSGNTTAMRRMFNDIDA
jgi:hypothetical protein